MTLNDYVLKAACVTMEDQESVQKEPEVVQW